MLNQDLSITPNSSESDFKAKHRTYSSFQEFYEKKLSEINKDPNLSDTQKDLKAINLIKFLLFNITTQNIRKFLTENPNRNFKNEFTNSYRSSAIKIANFFNQTSLDQNNWFLLLVKNLLANVFYNHTFSSNSSQLLDYCRRQINILFDVEQSLNKINQNSDDQQDVSFIPRFLFLKIPKDKSLDNLDWKFSYFNLLFDSKKFYLSFTVNAQTYELASEHFQFPVVSSSNKDSIKRLASINFYNDEEGFLGTEKNKKRALSTAFNEHTKIPQPTAVLRPAKSLKTTDALALFCKAQDDSKSCFPIGS